MVEQPKIAGFALLDDFNGDVLRNLGSCLYQSNIIPIVISLKKGRNVVDREKTMMTETDLTFARARTQIDALVLADDYSIENLKQHAPFRTLIKKMLENNQLVVAVGKAQSALDEIKEAKGQSNLITANSLKDYQSVCKQVSNRLKKAA